MGLVSKKNIKKVKFLIIPFSFLEALITFLPVHRYAFPLALQQELHAMQ